MWVAKEERGKVKVCVTVRGNGWDVRMKVLFVPKNRSF